MDNAAYEAEEKRLALVNAQLDTKLKEAEIAEKIKPWRSLTSPTTLMALITVVIAVLGAFVNLEQFWGSKQSEKDARAATELIAERGLVSNVMQQSGSDPIQLCIRLSGLHPVPKTPS